MMEKLPVLITALFAGLAAGLAGFALLRFLSAVEIEKAPEVSERKLPLYFRLVRPLLPLGRRLASLEGFSAWRDTVAPQLWMAGYGEVFRPVDFIGYRILFLLLALFFLLLGMTSGNVGLCLLLAVLLAFYPGLWLRAVIRARQLSIMKALPNVLDLLTLSVESGRDLLSSLHDILSRRRPDPLGEELMRTFREIQLGRKRTEALRALSNRVRQTDLTAVVNAIIQAEELGVSIAQLLRIQGDMLRNKRFTLAEKMANEAAVKIIFPVVVCILPPVFGILLIPLVLQTARVFS